jgi:large subunit ribosomal protein L4
LPWLLQPRDWSIKMNKKERRLALATALQSAASDILVVDPLEDQVADKKTKTLLSVLAKVGLSDGGAIVAGREEGQYATAPAEDDDAAGASLAPRCHCWDHHHHHHLYTSSSGNEIAAGLGCVATGHEIFQHAKMPHL